MNDRWGAADPGGVGRASRRDAWRAQLVRCGIAGTGAVKPIECALAGRTGNERAGYERAGYERAGYERAGYERAHIGPGGFARS